jgi:hypothetical protein
MILANTITSETLTRSTLDRVTGLHIVSDSITSLCGTEPGFKNFLEIL